MLDVAVHNEAENWFFNKRFAALPREEMSIEAEYRQLKSRGFLPMTIGGVELPL